MRAFHLMLAAALLAGAPAQAQRITWRGIPWGSGIQETADRLRLYNYHLVKVDTSLMDLGLRFASLRGDTVRMGFTVEGLHEVVVRLEPMRGGVGGTPFELRKRMWSDSLGPGEPVGFESWAWSGGDTTALSLSAQNGRLTERFHGPQFVREFNRKADRGRVVLDSLRRVGMRWLPTRIDTGHWRPLGASDSIGASWDSAGAVRSAPGRVTATVRWDFREPIRWGGYGPFTAFVMRAEFDCGTLRLAQWPQRISWYRGATEVTPAPDRLPPWIGEVPLGPRLAQVLCERVR